VVEKGAGVAGMSVRAGDTCAYCGQVVGEVGSPAVAEMVREFHETYNCPIGIPINQMPSDLAAMRRNILVEEVREYNSASVDRDLVEIADALADIVYVAYGTALTYGIDLDVVLAEVHRSNMSKLDADGKPIMREDGKVLKGPNYFKPNIRKALGLEGDNVNS